jgi:hypothetical protein
VLDSVKAGDFGALTVNTTNAANGTASIASYSAVGTHTDVTIGTLFFTAASGPGGTRIAVAPSVVSTALGGDLRPVTRTRPLDVCIGTILTWGDANGDGFVNIIDAQQIARYTVSLGVANQAALVAQGDVTNDGVVNIIDAQQIARASVGLSAAARVNTTTSDVPPVVSVVLTPSTPAVAIGGSVQLSSTAVDANSTDLSGCAPVSYASGTPSVATVDAGGIVTGVTPGTTTITATSGIRSAQVTLTVLPAAGLSILAVSKGGVPANLVGLSSAVDVTVQASGPPGLLNLIQNCTAGGATSTTGDVIVAQTVTSGSAVPTPYVLTYNTAATGTVSAGVAMVDPAASTPIAINGSCVLKARLGSLDATNTIAIALANENVYRATSSFTKTTTRGAASAVSTNTGVQYSQGDLTVVVSPVMYTADVPASLTVTYAGRSATSGTFINGKFLIVFPATGTTAASINQYTSPLAGDQVTAGVMTDAGGTAIPVTGTVLFTGLHSDNESPDTGSPLAANLPATGFINAAYVFASHATRQSDAAFVPSSQNVLTFYAGTPAPGATFPSVPSTDETAARCSTAGLTLVATGADLPQSPAGAVDHFVRVIENDPVGNLVCQDFGPFGIDKNLPTITLVAGPADKTVITSGQTLSFTFADSISGFSVNQEISLSNIRNFTQCVYGGPLSAGCTVTTGPVTVIDNSTAVPGYYSIVARSMDRGGNLSTPIARTYLLDATAPIVQGISVPGLIGGTTVQFNSTATDNVDLKSAAFEVAYAPPSGAVNLFYLADDYGPNFDATRVTSATINAVIPFFIAQLQGTSGTGAPVPFLDDHGIANSVSIRAFDAANLASSPSTTTIASNVSSPTGFTSAQLTTFAEKNTAVTVSNRADVGPTVTLSAAAQLSSSSAQSANVPFAQVCFYYQQSAEGYANDNTVLAGRLVNAGCVTTPDVTDVANVSRTWTYTLPSFDPPRALGTSSSVKLYAIGMDSGGVGILTPVNTQVVLVP